jgi:hypothetical protein
MTEREFAVASLVQRAMKGDMGAIKLALKLDREAESVERAAAREYERTHRKVFEWTDEQERLYQEFCSAAGFEAKGYDASANHIERQQPFVEASEKRVHHGQG